MRKLMLMALLFVGCAVITQPKRPAPLPRLELEPVSYQIVKTPVAVKYTVIGLTGYEKHIPRVKKYFELLVNDKTILDSHKFQYNTDSADTIREKIARGFDVKVQAFTPNLFNAAKWWNTIAYHDDWTIYINTKKMRRPDCAVINTIAHESTHAWGYGHGSDSPIGKSESFPYWAGNNAEELCLAGKI